MWQHFGHLKKLNFLFSMARNPNFKFPSSRLPRFYIVIVPIRAALAADYSTGNNGDFTFAIDMLGLANRSIAPDATVRLR